jgi:hypothetical protein
LIEFGSGQRCRNNTAAAKKELASGETPASAVFGHDYLNATGIG